jgi:hypothetical protein
LKIKDIVHKVSNDQFIYSDFMVTKKMFALTESTPKDYKFKALCIDFGEKVNRFINLDALLLILKEFYGKDYLIKSINEIKYYDSIKDIEIK